MPRTLVATRPGGPEVLAVEEWPAPVPTPGTTLVDVAAVGVNFIDVYQREGLYPVPTPFVVGNEGAGIVADTGDRVAWAMFRGSAAEQVAVPTAQLVPVPDAVSLEVAAAAMLQGMTAHYLATSTYPVQPGDICLVHAAAGGVGQVLVQLIKARGGVVVATAGSAAKLAIAASLGADHLINYSEVTDLAAAVRSAVGGGVHVAYDGVGQATFDASLASLRPRGLLALFGAASGPVPPFDLQRLNAAGSAYVTRPTLASYVADREELLWRAGEVLDAVATGRLRIAIGGTFGFDDAAEAYRALEGRRTTGKLLLRP